MTEELPAALLVDVALGDPRGATKVAPHPGPRVPTQRMKCVVLLAVATSACDPLVDDTYVPLDVGLRAAEQ